MMTGLHAVAQVAVIAHAWLFGVVRSSNDGAPIPGVAIAISGSGRSTSSDREGRYAFDSLEPGRYDLRLRSNGFQERELAIVLVVGDSLRVDVALEPVPRALPAMRVIGVLPSVARETGAGDAFGELGVRSRGAPQWRSEGSWLAQPDAFAAFDGAPGVSFDIEKAASLHVHGGESDQNLVLIDGAPVLAPYHFGGTVGALSPDALAGIQLHAGVPSASLAGALSSIVGARTLAPGRALAVSGAIGAMDARLTIDGPITPATGFVVSARRELPPLFDERSGDSRVAGAYDDVLAKFTAGSRRGTLELLYLLSDNVVRFPATTAPPEGGSDSSSVPDLGGLGDQPGPPASHRFAWRGTTTTARWDGSSGLRGMTLQVWHAGLRTGVDWKASPSALELTSTRLADGLSAHFTRMLGRGSLSAGMDVERDHLRYDLTSAGTGIPARASSDTSVTTTAAFVEHRFHSARFEASAGLRTTLGMTPTTALEPRAAVTYRVRGSLEVGLGFSRQYQPFASLRNPASLASAVFSSDLPVVPSGRTARADQIVIELSGKPEEHSVLLVEGYWRWLEGLALAEPVTGQPFAVDRYGIGSGEAAGVSLAFERRGARAAFAATYSLGLSSRAVGVLDYHVGFQPQHALVTSLALNATPSTLLRVAAHAHTSTPTSVVGGSFDFEACDPLDAGCEAAGTPQRTVGPLNGVRVPSYLRVDVGIRHAWVLHIHPRPAEAAAYASFGNVFGRHNLWGYTSTVYLPDRRAGLAARPASLLAAGMEWRW